MPLSKYFHGEGKEVMANMVREYGPEKGKRVFYATANKHGGANRRKRSRRDITHNLRRRHRHG